MKLLTVLITLASLSPVLAQELTFRPHDPAAPEATVGGSIRGSSGELALTPLAPPTLAATSAAAPALYWHSSAAVSDPVEIVLVAEGGAEPLLEVTLDPPLAAGVHRYEVPAEIELAVGQTYQWSVAAVPDPNARSNDVFASALMQRVATPVATGDDPLANAAAMAAAGLWYDSLDLLSQLRDSNPQAASLHRQLLRQAGLDQLSPL